MRDIQDMKYDVIAQAMDLPLNTVKVYLHRARKMLMVKVSSNSEYQIQPEQQK